MGTRLDRKVGKLKYDNLVADNCPPANVFSITIAAGEGELKRGSVMALDIATGKMQILSTSSTGLQANCVLCDDVDATEETKTLAYKTGHLNRQELIVKDGYTMTLADEEALRAGGILLSDCL